jgi:hypothetical protein
MDFRNSSKERKVFWEAYRACAEENGVRPDRLPFYVNWANDFANFLPEKFLKIGPERTSGFGVPEMMQYYRKRIEASRYLNRYSNILSTFVN